MSADLPIRGSVVLLTRRRLLTGLMAATGAFVAGCSGFSSLPSLSPSTPEAPAGPPVDRAKKTVTVYSAEQHLLVTFAASDDLLALPDDTWRAGDVVRYYYKEPGQALRFMNVTKTDLSKSGG